MVAAFSLVLLRFGVPIIAPGFEGFRVAIFGLFACVLAIVVWWTAFSRAPHQARWGALGAIALALAASSVANHESMGLMWGLYYALPLVCLMLVAWAVGTARLPRRHRRMWLAAALLLLLGPWALVRMDGLTGDHVFHFSWRFAEAPTTGLLQPVVQPQPGTRPQMELPVPAERSWPGFRGMHRDGVVSGLRIRTDWTAQPPVALWRRTVGAGWSSFAVGRGRVYTQEQQAEEEVVSCYGAATGESLWSHRDPVRFYESMGGPGPRATPALSGGRLYALGATGLLNALDAESGVLVWSRDLVADLQVRLPIWGFASSPLVVGDVVVVAMDGALVAYDLSTGERRWLAANGGASYSSPHRMTIDGVEQIVYLDAAGATSVTPNDGKTLWQHAWPGAALVQPAQTANGDLLVSAGEGEGLRRLAVAKEENGWRVEERWESRRLKPNFNDFVVHRGYAYGFDGRILASIDLEDGTRKWKGGRYGHGQLILLADQDLLLVLSEVGELFLVAAKPDEFSELASFPALDGKTWNHPVLAGDLLLVRNGREMAAFRLELERPAS